jgi:pimeloyl-ACP methyl ester carboxylesterase
MPGLKHITGAADQASEGEPGSWVSDAARETFMAAYDRVLALWPQPLEDLDIETATATTRVHAYRPHPGGAPVVLLTGAGGNAAFWFPHVAALAEAGPVYAIDVPVLLVTGARSALLTPEEARARGSLMPHAEVAIVPGSHGGFNRISEVNDRITAFIKAQAAGKRGGKA